MLLLIRSVVATTLLLAMVSPADAQPVRRSQPNVAGVELLGRALIYSSRSGFIIRPALNLLLGSDPSFVWPGITLAKSF